MNAQCKNVVRLREFLARMVPFGTQATLVLLLHRMVPCGTFTTTPLGNCKVTKVTPRTKL